MNKSHLTITTGILGLSLGLIINTESRNAGFITGILGMGSFGVSMMVNPASKKDDPRELRTELNKAQTELRTLSVKLSNVESKETSARSELEETKQKLSTAIEVLKTCESERLQGLETMENLNQELMIKAEKIRLLELNVETLQDEIDEWDSSFENQLEEKFQEALRTRIKQIESENDAITREAIQLCKEYRDWADKAATRNVERGDFVRDITRTYSNKISEVRADWDKTISEYLTQIEILNNKVAMLQQKLTAVINGDLIQPELLDCGYSIEGRIANSIAEWMWNHQQIPLAVKGFEVKKDGSTEVGYGYSRSIPVEALVSDLNRFSGDIARMVGIHKITSVRKLAISDLISLTFRREAAIGQEEIKRLLTPIEKVAAMVIREMSRKSTIRIMGATGDGKGICARYLLSEIVKSLNWYIRLHDPQDDSAEDYWGIPKVSKSGSEMKKALKAISKQMIERESSKVHSPVTLDILDEIDTQLEKDDKGQFLDLISRIRHLGMKLILIGQNPKVSRAGFQWADMAQMIAFYQGSVALDAIKNNPTLELKRDILMKQYEEISSVFEAKNQYLDDAKKHYFGLCVIPGKSPIWYELPIADEVEIQGDKSLLGENFEIPSSLMQSVESKSKKFCDNTNDGKTADNTAETTPIVGASGSAVIAVTASQPTLLPTCKKHPEVELKSQSDGRYYCKSCKKRVPKSDLDYR